MCTNLKICIDKNVGRRLLHSNKLHVEKNTDGKQKWEHSNAFLFSPIEIGTEWNASKISMHQSQSLWWNFRLFYIQEKKKKRIAYNVSPRSILIFSCFNENKKNPLWFILKINVWQAKKKCGISVKIYLVISNLIDRNNSICESEISVQFNERAMCVCANGDVVRLKGFFSIESFLLLSVFIGLATWRFVSIISYDGI